MLVMKFGGSSLADAARIRRAIAIVRERLAEHPLVVVSAHGGVTDTLLEQAKAALEGKQNVRRIVERHRTITRNLGLQIPEHEVLFRELSDLMRGISFVGEITPRVLDLVASFGERLSAWTVAAAMTAEGLEAEAVMAYDAGLVTDARFGRARPQPESDEQIRKFFAGRAKVPVVTGYIAKDKAGNVTTLGRNGSDFSAALFARALRAQEIQIWKDVPGVMTADPRIVPEARPLLSITYDEAAELAYYGAQVLHPATMLPAIEAQIPVRVLDTTNPHGPNTLILPQVEQTLGAVRAIVHKRGVHLVNIVTPRMLGHHGFMARIFEACARHEVVLDMIATTEVSVSATVDASANLEPVIEDLKEIGQVSVDREVASVAVVGHGIGESPELVSSVFKILTEQSIPTRMISMGATRTNVGLVLDEVHMRTAVQALHRGLLGGPTPRIITRRVARSTSS